MLGEGHNDVMVRRLDRYRSRVRRLCVPLEINSFLIPLTEHSEKMRNYAATQKGRTIEDLANESRAIISQLPEPTHPNQTWDPQQLSYTEFPRESKPPVLYDCQYIDSRGISRCWVMYADSIQHVIESFNELVGEGRIVSILPSSEWD